MAIHSFIFYNVNRGDNMILTWHGHSCFTLECQEGIIVFDPYKNGSVPGLKDLKLQAHAVLCSHEHTDHNAREVVTLLESKDFKISYIDSFHDDKAGTLRGNNRIYIVKTENMKVVHLGDLGCSLKDYSQIQNCDVLMIPIGGYYTINTEQALKIIQAIKPRIVIPMHYRSETFGYDEIDTIDCFIRKSKNIIRYYTNSIEITKDTVNQTAILKYI